MKTPEQIASDIVCEYGGHGIGAYQNIIRAIEADRAQRPALEQWAIFEEKYPHDAETYNCDQEAAEEIARVTTAEDRTWGCRQYIARRVENAS